MEENKMKKLIALLLALCMVLSLAACGGNATSETEAPKAPAADAGNAETPAADEFTLAPIKVGVLVADVSSRCVGSRCIICRSISSGCIVAAASSQAQNHAQSQEQSNEFFHFVFLQLLICFIQRFTR